MEAILKRRDLLIQHMQRSSVPEESYLRYVKTINDTCHILRRTIDPSFPNDREYKHQRQELRNLQGTDVRIGSEAQLHEYVIRRHRSV